MSSSNTTTRSTASSAASTSARALHILHRTVRALQPLHRGVAVEPDHQPVAGAARLRQHLDVAGMQDIETAIGEADAQSLPAPVRRAVRRVRRQSNTIFSSAASDACGRMRARSSASETVAVPRLPTTTAAAALAARIAVSQSAPAASISRQHRDHGVARAGDIAHLDRIGRHVDRLRRRAPPASCRRSLRVTSTASQSASASQLAARPSAIFGVGVGAAAGRLGQFLAVRRDQRRAAIDRVIGALGIDDHRLAGCSRGIDDVADHARASARPWRSPTAPRRRRAAAAAAPRRSAASRSRRRPAAPVPNRRAAYGWSNAPTRSAPCAWSGASGSTTSCGLDARLRPRASAFSVRPASSSPTRPTNMQRAPRLAILRATLPAPPIIDLAALDRDHRRRRLRRDARHLAIDEVVQHQIADAQHGLARG